MPEVLTPGAVTGSEAVVTGASSEPLSVRAYARHRNTSAPSVLRAIKSGRLKNSLVIGPDGKAKIANVALADDEWTANTDLSKAPGYVKARPQVGGGVTPPPAQTVTGQEAVTPPPAKPQSQAQGSSAPAGELTTLADASAEEKRWKARLAELEYLERSGQLVNAAAVADALTQEVIRCRTKLLSIASKAKAAIPHLTHAEIRTLDDLVRQALEELAAESIPAKVAAA